MMDTLVKADIFFFVSTIAVGVVAVFLVIALIYAIQILTRAKRMVIQAEIAGEKIYSIYYFIRRIIRTII
jgi:hypothetical protein